MSARRDLSSIYRLDFYKKQKYWKLSGARRGTKPHKCGNQMALNVTYNIEDDDAHNMAFTTSPPVEKTTSDTNTSSSSTKRLSLQWQQPINIYPDSETKDEHRQSPKKKPLSYGVTERLAALQQAVNSYKEDVNNNELQEMDSREDLWQQQQSYDLKYTEGAAQGAGYEMIGDGNGDGLCQTDIFMMADAACDFTDDCSVDSEGEFMRGAHAAPHSSEIDLPLSSVATGMSFKELSLLSAQQLSAAAFHHSMALRRLFLESKLRQGLAKSTSLPLEYNLASDNIVAGSHLQETMTRERDWVHANLLY